MINIENRLNLAQKIERLGLIEESDRTIIRSQIDEDKLFTLTYRYHGGANKQPYEDD